MASDRMLRPEGPLVPQPRRVTAGQSIYVLIYLYGASLAGLAAIHFAWRNPSILGPFAMVIGMTPLVMLFEYSLELPGYWVWVGSVIAGVFLFGLRKTPLPPRVTLSVILSGMLMAVLSVLVFIVASAYYDVGAAGPLPPEWLRWVQPGTKVGEVGLVLIAAGLLLWKAAGGNTRYSSNSQKIAEGEHNESSSNNWWDNTT
jgi:hypothetical protein